MASLPFKEALVHLNSWLYTVLHGAPKRHNSDIIAKMPRQARFGQLHLAMQILCYALSHLG